MNISFWISRRLSLDTGGSRTGIVVAVTGVALAVAVMEFTLAVMVGFKHEIERKLTGFDAQISIQPPVDSFNGVQRESLSMDDALLAIAGESAPGARMELAVRQPGILKTDEDFEGALFIGRDASSPFEFERGNIVEGVWPDYSADSTMNHIVVSRTMASALGLTTGDRLYTTFIVDGDVKMRRQTVAGIYESDFGDYDKTVVYASLPFLQHVAGLDSVSGTAIELRGIDRDDIADVASELQSELITQASLGHLDAYYPVSSVEQTGAMYFNWLALLDTNVIVIFVLMLAVASFTLISSLFILILERVRTIGILRALGSSKPVVRRIFVHMAMRIVAMGLIIGNVVGVGLLLVQKKWELVPLDPDMYYLSSVPVEIQVPAFIALNIGVVVATWLILVLPAHLASGIDPAGAVKYD